MFNEKKLVGKVDNADIVSIDMLNIAEFIITLWLE